MASTKLNAFFDRVVPAAYQADPARYTQAKILFAVILFNNIYCVLSLIYVRLGLAGLSAEIRQMGYNLIFIGMFVYVLALFSYYGLRQLRLAGHLTVSGLFLAAICSLFVTGGYMESPMPVLVMLAPTFAFLLMGLRPGMAWSVFSMTVLIGMWVLEQKQLIEFRQVLTDPLIKRNLTLWIPLTVGVMMIAAMAIYESITMRLCSELQREKNKFMWEATHDALTELPNRPEFFQRLQLGMRQAEVNQQNLALVYIDLDGFKPVNDQLGHHAGDEVLKVVSKRLQSIVRGSDCVARLGGDEFAVILQGVSKDAAVLDQVLMKILKAITEKMIIEGQEVSVGASMGVAFYQNDRMDASVLCRKADEAMYTAKQSKNTWRFYEA